MHLAIFIRFRYPEYSIWHVFELASSVGTFYILYFFVYRGDDTSRILRIDIQYTVNA